MPTLQCSIVFVVTKEWVRLAMINEHKVLLDKLSRPRAAHVIAALIAKCTDAVFTKKNKHSLEFKTPFNSIHAVPKFTQQCDLIHRWVYMCLRTLITSLTLRDILSDASCNESVLVDKAVLNSYVSSLEGMLDAEGWNVFECAADSFYCLLDQVPVKDVARSGSSSSFSI